MNACILIFRNVSYLYLQKEQIFQQLLEEKGDNKQKLSCISTWCSDFPSLTSNVLESVLNILETENDVYV